MAYTFTAEHTGAAFRAAVAAFRDTYADDPIQMIRSGHITHYREDIQERARFLDAWDAWLFTEEAEQVLGDG